MSATRPNYSSKKLKNNLNNNAFLRGYIEELEKKVEELQVAVNLVAQCKNGSQAMDNAVKLCDDLKCFEFLKEEGE